MRYAGENTNVGDCKVKGIYNMNKKLKKNKKVLEASSGNRNYSRVTYPNLRAKYTVKVSKVR